MDVLLHNLITIIKQNQDIRKVLSYLRVGQRKSGHGKKKEKLTVLDMEEDDEFAAAIYAASKTYFGSKGDMMVEITHRRCQ